MIPQNNIEEPTVFIVDDDASICEGISNLLESMGLRAKTFGSTQEFLAGWNEDMPGCLMLDVRLPGMTGVEFQEQLARSGINIPIIIMTAHGDIPMVRKVMKAGAIEFLTKPFQREDLLNGISQALEYDRNRRAELASTQSILAHFESLTPREREVMSLVTAGLLNKQVAADLGLSEVTVKQHRGRVMEKMQAGSLADLVRMADQINKLNERLFSKK
jgi:FixJ family two-component response regulator